MTKTRSKFLLSSGAIALTICAFSPVAFAQEVAVDGGDDAIIVTGIRKSLSDAANIKREASGVVDAISAEDIGKFPDANLAESLQRISGVSIDRSNNEGNQVTVRGFGPGFNLVTLNSRQMPNSSSLQSAGISRSFNFRDLASEGVSAVEVYKTGRADIVSGGLGATINIRTPRPLDDPGFRAVASAKANWDTTTEVGAKVTPEITGLISTTFADDRIGILAIGSYSERNSRKDRAGTQGWVRNRGNRANPNLDLSAIDTTANPTAAFWTPWTIDMDVWDSQRKRTNGQLVVQAEPVDGLTITADYTMSRYKERTQMHRMAFWFDRPDIATADANGTLVDITTLNDNLDFWSWDFYQYTKNDSFAANIAWDVTDNLSFEIDAHDSTSHSNPNTKNGQTAETLSNLRNPIGSIASISGNFSGKIPTASFDDSTLAGGGLNFANVVSDLYQKRGYEVENNIRQLQFAGKWKSDDGALKAINFGADYTDYKVDTLLSATFRFVNVPLGGLEFGFVPRGNTLDQFKGADQLFGQIPIYSATDFVGIVEDAGLFSLDPPSLNGVREKTKAAFVSFDLETDFNSMPIRINAGLRYEKTNVSAYTVQNGIVALNFRHPQELQVIRDTTSDAAGTPGRLQCLPAERRFPHRPHGQPCRSCGLQQDDRAQQPVRHVPGHELPQFAPRRSVHRVAGEPGPAALHIEQHRFLGRMVLPAEQLRLGRRVQEMGRQFYRRRDEQGAGSQRQRRTAARSEREPASRLPQFIGDTEPGLSVGAGRSDRDLGYQYGRQSEVGLGPGARGDRPARVW